MLDETRVAQLLAQTEIFATLSDAHRLAIARACKVVSFEEKARIVGQGEEGAELYIVGSGEVAVVLEDEHLGTEQSVLKLGPGQSFGEVSLLSSAPRSATVKALTATLCVALAKASFESVLRQIPEVAVEVSRYLAARLHRQCQLTGFRFVSLEDLVYDPELHALFPSGLLSRLKAVPLELRDGTLVVALTRPNEWSRIQALREGVPGLAIEPVACAAEDFVSFEERFRPQESTRAPALPALDGVAATFLLEPGGALSAPLTSVLAQATERAINHLTLLFEGNEVAVYDSSGTAPKEMFRAEGETASHLAHQLDGLFRDRPAGVSVARQTLVVNQHRCALEVSRLNTLAGKRVSLLLSDPSANLPRLGTIMPLETMRETVLKCLRTGGLGVLLAGAPRSGRTTTCYALLRTMIDDFGWDNILTLEENPLFALAGAAQVKTENGWQSLLEASLMQRPRLLFVDDFSSLDQGTLPNLGGGSHSLLLSMRSDDPLSDLLNGGREIANSNIELVVHQKALPRLCPHCRAEHQPSSAVLSRLKREGMTDEGQVFFHSSGCERCRGTGVSATVPVFEMIRVNPLIREMIEAARPAEAVKRAARDNQLFLPFQASAARSLKLGEVAATDVLRHFGSSSRI